MQRTIAERWRRRGSPSLRLRLVILVGLVAALLAADRARDIVIRRGDLLASARGRLHDVARVGSGRGDDVISDIRALLTLATEMPETSPEAGLACHKTFERTTDAIPWLVSLAAADASGRIFCSSRGAPTLERVLDRPYFQEALTTRGFVLSEFLKLRYDNQPGLVAAMPRIVDGRVDAVVLARIDLDWFNALVTRVVDETGKGAILSDAAGTILAAYPDADLVGRKVSTVGLPLAPSGRAPFLDVTGPDGRDWIYATAGPGFSGIRLYVGAPSADILAPAVAEATLSVIKLLAGLLVCAGALWIGVERLVLRPVGALARVAARLGAGELAVRADARTPPPELARLAEAFNAMATQLELRDAELRGVNERLAELATVDALTGLANRRLFDERLAQEWRRSERTGRPLGLVIVDVDRFKLFNDTYGHLAGDACLRAVARAIAEGLRPGDLAARLGGEEFALLLPASDEHRALHVGRLVRREVEAIAVPHAGTPAGILTISAGAAAAVPMTGASSTLLVQAADEALYRAKRAGRNRVVGSATPAALAS